MVKCQYCEKEIPIASGIKLVDETNRETSAYCDWNCLTRYCIENDPDMVQDYNDRPPHLI